MLPLQHVRLWRRLSVILLVIVLIAALSPAFWFDTKIEALSWFQHTDKWLHGLTFATLAVWFAGLFDRTVYWRVAAGLMAFGLGIEACQLLVGYRMADWIDAVANLIGIIAGLTVAVAGLGGWALRIEAWYAGRTRA